MKNLILVLALLAIFAGHVLAGEMKMYWSDIGTGWIHRANLDGTDIEDIYHEQGSPKGLALDMVNSKLYFNDKNPGGAPEGKMLRSNLDGSEVEILVTNLHVPRGVDLDLLNGKMYWGQVGGGTTLLQRANLDGTALENLIIGASPMDVALHLRMEKIYWVDGEYLWRSNLNGSHAEIISSNFDWPLGIDIDLLEGKIYVTDSGELSIKRMNLDGSEMEDIVTQDSGYLLGISLDTEEGKMYWVDWGDGLIQRANLDGTEKETLIDSGLVTPWYIELTVEPDIDGDGITTSQDKCPETRQEEAAFMGLKVNRYADIDNDNTFETKLPSGEIVDSEFDMSNTKGCSCSQILDSLPGNHEGQRKFGCTKQTLLGSKNVLRIEGACPWDVNGDGVVDHRDLVEVVHNLGQCDDSDNCPWDVNGDGIVNGRDVAAVAMHFGACP